MRSEGQNRVANENENEEFRETDPLRENVEEQKEETKRTFRETCCYVVKNITVEPTMFFFILAIVLGTLTSQNLNLEKACRVNLNFTTEICDALKLQTLEEGNVYERDVQKLVARAMTWKTYITATLPCVLALFIGSWADRTGYRKIFIVIAIAGQILNSVNGILNYYFFYQLPLEVFVFTDAIIDGISGSWCVCFLTLFSYISAITTDENRTFRMGLINFSLTVGFPVGMGTSGILFKTIGFYGCYGIVAGLNFINLLYNIFILKDPPRTPEQQTHVGKGAFHYLRLFFDLTNIKETIQVVFKKGANNRRFRICTFLVVVSILFGPMHGELSIMYISTRYRFNWDALKFSIFQAYNFVTHTFGTIFSILVFSKYLKWHDSVLGIISTVSKIMASFVYCFAPNERIFYIAPLVDILNGTSLLALRSIVSKLVAANEFGKVNSIFALTENLMPLVYVPLYTKMYVATMDVLPGAVFLLGSAMTLPAVVVFILRLLDGVKSVECEQCVSFPKWVKSNAKFGFVKMAESENTKSADHVDMQEMNKDEPNETAPLKPNDSSINNKSTKKKLTFSEKVKLIKNNITVEPIMACYIMPSILASLATQNLNLEKVCLVNLKFGKEVCDALKSRQTANYTEYEEQVQTYTAEIQAWKNVVQTAIPVMIILFVGAWSDKTGKRKICILLPIVGEFLTCIGFILNTYFFYELPAEVAALTESIFPAITGGWFTNFIGVFSYIGDITSVEDRTFRVGLVNLFMSLGYPIGSALSGVLLSWIGYYGIFSLSASLYLFSLIYGYFCLEDPKKKVVKRKHSGCFGFIREFFDVALVMETFKVAFKKGPGNRRLRVCLLLTCVCVVFGPLQGEFTIMYLFTRFRFNWDEVMFSMWSTYSIVTNLIGTAFSISLFSNYLKLDDTLLAIISCMSKIVGAFAYAFARNNLEIYIAPLLEILNGTSFIAMRSIATKLVSGEEFGKVNSLFGLAEAMTPIVYGPLYSRTYVATLNILPGAVFLLGALLTVPAVIILGWLYFEHRKDRKMESNPS